MRSGSLNGCPTMRERPDLVWTHRGPEAAVEQITRPSGVCLGFPQLQCFSKDTGLKQEFGGCVPQLGVLKKERGGFGLVA